jgi:mono/diheme cytochrome c family protein
MSRFLSIFIIALMVLLVVAACAGVAEEPAAAPAQAATQGDSEQGRQLFAASCGTCHGPTGEGVQGLGADMRQNEFIAGQSDEALLAFIKEGRPIDHPQNTTGVQMPPYGGNPTLTDEQLFDIIAFLRSLQ